MPYANVREAQQNNPGIHVLTAPAKRAWTAVFNNAKKRGLSDQDAAKEAWAAAHRVKVKKSEEVQMEKSFIEVDGDRIAIGVPFSKVDVQHRTVEGFATLDNIDHTGEIVDFAASQEAFKSWLGNIREMHGPRAVGKALSIEEKTKEVDGSTYNGMYVKAYISKGAEDTWAKVLDGTLQGFSIGGKVFEKRPEVAKSNDPRFARRNVVRITKYMLGELSVVDNPANPLALFDSVQKAQHLVKFDNEELHVTDVIGTDEQTIFYCKNCDVAKMESGSLESASCSKCNENMMLVAITYESPSIEDVKKMVMERLAEDATDDLGKSLEILDVIDGEDTEKAGAGAKMLTHLKEVHHKDVSAGMSIDEMQAMHDKVHEDDDEDDKAVGTEDLLQNINDGKNVNKLLDDFITAIADKIQVEKLEKAQGGDFEKVDTQALQSILDVLKTAFGSVEELLTKAGVVSLNSETASDTSVNTSASLPSGEGADNAAPDKIPTSGEDASADVWAAAPSDANVLPHMSKSDEEETTETEVIEKSEAPAEETPQSEDMLKTFVTDELGKLTNKTVEALENISKGMENIVERIEKLENSGAGRKSGEVNEELSKSQKGSFWGGSFFGNS